jgi:hypothetical protein
VVVALGVTDVLPLSGSLPSPLSMETLVAFVLVQKSVLDAPDAIDVGLAVSVTVGGDAVVT